MKKALLATIFFGLVATFVLTGIDAADEVTTLGEITPEGYDYTAYESCVNCHRVKGKGGNWHQENVLGVKVTRDAEGVVTKTEVTGDGWVSSKHAVSMEGKNANTYCAYCHAPGYAKVTNDPTKAKAIKSGKPGMGCVACHCGHTMADELGSRYVNYMPGADEDEKDSWKPVPYLEEHKLDGKKANKQCQFCHGKTHGFAVTLHETMQKSGSLACIDCHMATYNTLDSGVAERYHNMKVEENGPDACAKCHKFSRNQMKKKVAALLGAHKDSKEKLPAF
jgi:nitrate/TMAO reductase-like tetraheme cytochrome c subunit